jgi:transcriptional regulator
MYIPAHFAETDAAEVAGLMDANPLAVLVVQTAEGLVANHLPLLREGEGLLIGHIAKANRLHELVADGAEALAIFRGEEAFISPNWYPTKAEHHRHVPTWNYQVVHVAGRLRFQTDDKAKRKAVGLLTRKMEGEVNGAAGWRMADAPRDYLDTMLTAIVGLTLEITGIAAKSKVGQNRAATDYAALREKMTERGKPELAARMKRFRPD